MIIIEKVFFFSGGKWGLFFSRWWIWVRVGRSGQQRVYERKGWGFVKKPGPERKEKKKKEKKKKGRMLNGLVGGEKGV